MITFGEAIQSVQSLYSKGVDSDDSRLTPRHIYSALLNARSTLLRQTSNKNQAISQWVYQTIPCIELIPAQMHECPAAPKGCTILRSKYKLPKPIIGLEKNLIKAVTSLDGSIVFSGETFETQKYAKGNKYTFSKPTYFIHNGGYLYITVLKMFRAIPVTGLFEDPLEVYQYPTLCDEEEQCDCKDIYEYEFPIERNMVDTLIDLANQKLIIIMKQINEDKTNDASDNGEPTGMIHQPNQQQ